MNPKRKHSDSNPDADWQNEPAHLSPEELRVMHGLLQSMPVEGAPMGFTPALMKRVRAQRQIHENRFLWVTAGVFLAAAGAAGWFCIRVMDKPALPDFQSGWVFPLAALVLVVAYLTRARYLREKEMGR